MTKKDIAQGDKPYFGKWTVVIALGGLVISLFSFVIGVSSFLRGCDNSEQIAKLDFMTKASQFRPMVRIVGSPEVVRIQIKELNVDRTLPIDPTDAITFICDSVPKAIHVRL